MKYLLSTMISITAFAFFVTASSGLAQTPDGDTPAEEAVCDELKADGITKGLYGLCVAFCEAHDAASAEEPITEEQLSDILLLSPNGRILKNYNKKKDKANNPADPDMPCVRVEEPCPCWSAEHMAAVDGFHPDGSPIIVDGVLGFPSYCQEYGNGFTGDPANYVIRNVVSWDEPFGPDSGACQRYNRQNSEGIYELVALFYYGTGDTNNSLTLEQHEACKAQVLDCIDRVNQ